MGSKIVRPLLIEIKPFDSQMIQGCLHVDRDPDRARGGPATRFRPRRPEFIPRH